MLTFRTVIAALTFATLSAGALAQDVTVMISGGFKAALEKLAPQYEAKSGDRIVLISGPSMGKTPQAIPARLARGEKRGQDRFDLRPVDGQNAAGHSGPARPGRKSGRGDY
ncbi:substrate-binding domain-containing protein, partial [Enterobacter hormaechei]|uniref:substrate-binding domain-containing protein n=1 Tax=Enterobacter hormaechei TaxID=158836 RepID=UPI003D6DB92D